ncbi:MAG TPA: radical SAM protein [Propylenella sp.]|nr:radical SAM protein [Propylenella sp.]
MTVPGSVGTPELYFLDAPNTRRLYIVYSLRCNFACAHCLVNSSPARRERMSLDQALGLVAAAAQAEFRVVYLTGGEVFLYFRDMVALVDAISRLGMASVVETNASWAIDDRRTRERLSALLGVGLGCVAVSIDLYHLAYGSIETVLRVARIARELRLPCRIMVIASPDAEADEQIVGRLRREGLDYVYDTLMAIGRGGDVPLSGHLVQRGKCDSIGVTVMPDGEAAACSGAFTDERPWRNSPLYVGPLFGADAAERLAAVRKDPIVAAIDEHGHMLLEGALPEPLKSEAKPESACSGLCDYCHQLLASEPRVQAMRDRLPRPF